MENKEIENWQEIEGYEGLYEVSNFGRVRSLGNNKTRKTKILKVRKNTWGYLHVDLCKNGKAVISTDKNGVEEYFPSIREAERRYGFDNGQICACLKGRQKTCGGRTWRYANEKGEAS